MFGGIVSSLSLLIAPLGAPAPAPATPEVPLAPQATICNRHCDARDPPFAPGDRAACVGDALRPHPPLHFNDNDAMGWASSTTAAPATRSGWTGPSTAGAPGARQQARRHARSPRAPAGRRTPMYNVDDWGQPRRRRVARLRQGGRPARDRLHRVGPHHLERLGSAHRGGHRPDDVLSQRHPVVRDHRLVELGERAYRPHRQHPRLAVWTATATPSPTPTTAT